MSCAVASSLMSLMIALFSLCCYCKSCNPHQAAGAFISLTCNYCLYLTSFLHVTFAYIFPLHVTIAYTSLLHVTIAYISHLSYMYIVKVVLLVARRYYYTSSCHLIIFTCHHTLKIRHNSLV